MVGLDILVVAIGVRIPAPQQNSESDRDALFCKFVRKILVRVRDTSKIRNLSEFAKIPSARKVFLLFGLVRVQIGGAGMLILRIKLK